MKKPVTLLLALLLPHSGWAAQIEVMHWWTAEGEVKAAQVMRNRWQALGNQWQDFAIPGGGGQSAMMVLKSRALAANPPGAVQLKGQDLKEWAQLGFLRDMDALALEEQWDRQLSPFVRETISYQGHYLAVPFGIHRVNWLWVNPRLLASQGLNPPRNWSEFITVARQLQQAGIAPLAIGDDPWQLAVLFEAIALGEGGSDFFRQAFVELSPAALQGETMVKVLRLFHSLHAFVPANYTGLKWNQATRMLMEGQAAMQVTGDWAKGELTAAGLKPGEDILCLAAPGTEDKFNYNLDSIAMFKLNSPQEQDAQRQLAQMLMTPAFQLEFNHAKGSIPVLLNLSLQSFDSCSRHSAQSLAEATAHDDLVPSMSGGMTISNPVQQAIFEVLAAFFNDEHGNPEQTAIRLSRSIQAAR